MLVGNTLALECEEHNFLCVQAVDAWSAELRMSKNAVVCAIVREATLLAEGCVAHLCVVALIVLGGCHHNNDGKATRHGPFLFSQVSLATLNGVVFFANPEVLRVVDFQRDKEEGEVLWPRVSQDGRFSVDLERACGECWKYRDVAPHAFWEISIKLIPEREGHIDRTSTP